MSGDRFWISTNWGDTWKEVDKFEWIRWEQACGFHGHGPGVDRIATAGFSSGAIRGHMHYGWFDTDDPRCDTGPHKR